MQFGLTDLRAKFASLILKNITTCLAEKIKRGLICGLRLNYDKHLTSNIYMTERSACFLYNEVHIELYSQQSYFKSDISNVLFIVETRRKGLRSR